MSQFTDQQYLKNDQYRDSRNLDARVEIHRRFSTNSYGWFNWVFDALIKLPANARILELGCGPGYLWKECLSRIPEGWNITLSDLSPGMLDAAWRNLITTGRTFKFEEMDAQSIPYEDAQFDAIIANHMLYHVPDRPKALAEIKRVLKDDGRFFATTVGEDHLKEMNIWLARAMDEKNYSPFVQLFSLENGLSQLQEFFSHVNIMRYPDSLRVTDIELMMAYIRSIVHAESLFPDRLAEVEKELSAVFQKDGGIFVTKDSGLFDVTK